MVSMVNLRGDLACQPGGRSSGGFGYPACTVGIAAHDPVGWRRMRTIGVDPAFRIVEGIRV